MVTPDFAFFRHGLSNSKKGIACAVRLFPFLETIKIIKYINKTTPQVKQVYTIRIRKLGSYLISDMDIILANDMSVEDGCCIGSEIDSQIQK
jgi:divalent metal cation (Fe/Co/Zn/Cd) transporter